MIRIGEILIDDKKVIIENTLLVKSNLQATIAPSSSNDDSEGYAVGSLWIDNTAKRVYACTDASTGAAVWLLSTQYLEDLASDLIPDNPNSRSLGSEIKYWKDIYCATLKIASANLSYDTGIKIDKQTYATPNIVSSATGAIALDFENHQTHILQLTGNITLTYNNVKPGAYYILIVEQDGVGSHGITFPAGTKASGGALDLTGTANSIDIISVYVRSTGSYYCNISSEYTAI